MHILIIGPGSLGCLLVSYLFNECNENIRLSLLDHRADRADLISRKGIEYTGERNRLFMPVDIYSSPMEIEAADIVFLCVKSYDVDATMLTIAPILKQDTILLFTQNGIGHLGYASSRSNWTPVFVTTTEGANLAGPGCIHHAGRGKTYLGIMHTTESAETVALPPYLQHICDLLKKGGMDIEISPTIYSRLWEKLFINIGINGLTVIFNCKNGELLNSDEAMEMMRSAIEEAEQVAHKENIFISHPLEKTMAVCKATADNISSMLQDVRKKRKTEIDAINGAIIVLAEKHGIHVPINKKIYRLVKERESQVDND